MLDHVDALRVGVSPLQHPTQRVDLTRLRESFTKAVVKRMMTDVPWGVLLSGTLPCCQHMPYVRATNSTPRGPRTSRLFYFSSSTGYGSVLLLYSTDSRLECCVVVVSCLCCIEKGHLVFFLLLFYCYIIFFNYLFFMIIFYSFLLCWSTKAVLVFDR